MPSSSYLVTFGTMEKKRVSLLIGSSMYENKQLVSDTEGMTEIYSKKLDWSKVMESVYGIYRNKSSTSQSWCLVVTKHEAGAILEMKQKM